MSHVGSVYVSRLRSFNFPQSLLVLNLGGIYADLQITESSRLIKRISKLNMMSMEGVVLSVHAISWPTLACVTIGVYVRILDPSTGRQAS